MTRAERIADAFRRALKVREGEVLTPAIIEDRARNGCHYILEALLESDEVTPVGYDVHESAEAMAARLIK